MMHTAQCPNRGDPCRKRHVVNMCKLALMFKSWRQMLVVCYHREIGAGSPAALELGSGRSAGAKSCN